MILFFGIEMDHGATAIFRAYDFEDGFRVFVRSIDQYYMQPNAQIRLFVASH